MDAPEDDQPQPKKQRKSRLVIPPHIASALDEPWYFEDSARPNMGDLMKDYNSEKPKFFDPRTVAHHRTERNHAKQFFAQDEYGFGTDEAGWENHVLGEYHNTRRDDRLLILSVQARFIRWAFQEEGLTYNSIKNLLGAVRTEIQENFEFGRRQETLTFGHTFKQMMAFDGSSVFKDAWKDISSRTGGDKKERYFARPLYPQDAERMLLCLGVAPKDLRDRAFISVAVKVATPKRYWVDSKFNKAVLRSQTGNWMLTLQSGTGGMPVFLELIKGTLEHEAFTMYHQYRKNSGKDEGPLFELLRVSDILPIIRNASLAAGYPDAFFVSQSLFEGAQCSIVDQARLNGFSLAEALEKTRCRAEDKVTLSDEERLTRLRGRLDSRIQAERRSWISAHGNIKGRGPHLKDAIKIQHLHKELLSLPQDSDRSKNDGLPFPKRIQTGKDQWFQEITASDVVRLLHAIESHNSIPPSSSTLSTEQAVSRITKLHFSQSPDQFDSSLSKCVRLMMQKSHQEKDGAEEELLLALIAIKVMRHDNWNSSKVPDQVLRHFQLQLCQARPKPPKRITQTFEVGGSAGGAATLSLLQQRQEKRAGKKGSFARFPEPTLDGKRISEMSPEELSARTQHNAPRRSMPTARATVANHRDAAFARSSLAQQATSSRSNNLSTDGRTDARGRATSVMRRRVVASGSSCAPMTDSVITGCTIRFQRLDGRLNWHKTKLQWDEMEDCVTGKDVLQKCLQKKPRCVEWDEKDHQYEKYITFGTDGSECTESDFLVMRVKDIMRQHANKDGTVLIQYLPRKGDRNETDDSDSGSD